MFEYLGIDLVLPYLSVGPRSMKVKKVTKKAQEKPKKRKRKSKSKWKGSKKLKADDAKVKGEIEFLLKDVVVEIKAKAEAQNVPCADLKEIMHCVVDDVF